MCIVSFRIFFAGLFFITTIVSAATGNGLTSKENLYIKRMKSVERFATNHGIDFDDLAGVQLAEIMKRAAGFITDARTADKINTAVKRLDNLLQVHGGGLLLFNLVATFPKLSTAQLQVINDKFLNGGLDKTSAQVYLAGILASEFGVTLESIKKALALAQKITSRPTRPDSPTGISIRRILTRSHRVQKRRMPRVSGDYLSNLRVSLDYVYTEFEDKASPSTGKYHDWSLSLGGTLAENTDLSFAFVTSNLEDNGTFDTQRGTTLGADFSLIHKLNDNYGLGFYGFYQETDYEGIDQHSIGKGGGLIFTTWHDFDYVDISTVNSLSRAFFDFGQDTIYNGSLSVNRNWTDRISTSIKAMYTDSVVKTSVGDNSYWSFGGEIGILITESVYFALGYTTDVSIKDYENDVWNFHLSYSF